MFITQYRLYVCVCASVTKVTSRWNTARWMGNILFTNSSVTFPRWRKSICFYDFPPTFGECENIYTNTQAPTPETLPQPHSLSSETYYCFPPRGWGCCATYKEAILSHHCLHFVPFPLPVYPLPSLYPNTEMDSVRTFTAEDGKTLGEYVSIVCTSLPPFSNHHCDGVTVMTMGRKIFTTVHIHETSLGPGNPRTGTGHE